MPLYPYPADDAIARSQTIAMARQQGLLPQILARAYYDGRGDSARETGLPPQTFPETCPWTLDQVPDDTFWPESECHE